MSLWKTQFSYVTDFPIDILGSRCVALLDLSPVWVHPLFLRGIQRSDAFGAAGDLGQRVLVQSPPGLSGRVSPPHTLGKAVGEAE